VCGRAGILREGRLVEVASIASIVQQEEHHLKVWFMDGAPTPELPMKLGSAVRVVQRKPGMLHLAYHGACDGVLRWLGEHRVDRIETPRTSLEEAFMGYYSREPAASRGGNLGIPRPGGEQ
jgi:hypothetical protein